MFRKPTKVETTFIISSKKYLLSYYYMSGSILTTKDNAASKTGKVSALMKLILIARETETKQVVNEWGKDYFRFFFLVVNTIKQSEMK